MLINLVAKCAEVGKVIQRHRGDVAITIVGVAFVGGRVWRCYSTDHGVAAFTLLSPLPYGAWSVERGAQAFTMSCAVIPTPDFGQRFISYWKAVL
jgi:hypothetical protein